MQELTVISDAGGSDLLTAEAGLPSQSKGNVWSDWVGITASVACAIHCAAMPFVIAFLPMLGLSFLADEGFHKVMVGVCTVFALLAFVPGWRLHRRWLPAGIAAFGLTIIGTAAFVFEDTCACCNPTETAVVASGDETSKTVCTDENCEHCAAAAEQTDAEIEAPTALAGFVPWFTPFGGLLLVSAHLMNRRFSCRCGCCPPNAADAAS